MIFLVGVYLVIGAVVITKIHNKPKFKHHTTFAGREMSSKVVLAFGWILSVAVWPVLAISEAVD